MPDAMLLLLTIACLIFALVEKARADKSAELNRKLEYERARWEIAARRRGEALEQIRSKLTQPAVLGMPFGQIRASIDRSIARGMRR
ncbi:hypothetical protein SEA_MOLLYMUR_103 [Gordonia phage Mollymur]|uniref:Uncharacterized protein n=1 Tax=Gordonia phage Mollymur TaxID=2590895 RepID=A0A4Y6E9W5_9CAUD|nr:hypothetical protein PQB84_gp023 [Gordonia phage Mollymur]QDF15463.1 hypothetical protein SEA_MOLLYMUR_103 [Gordonia phage Mollymur]